MTFCVFFSKNIMYSFTFAGNHSKIFLIKFIRNRFTETLLLFLISSSICLAPFLLLVSWWFYIPDETCYSSSIPDTPLSVVLVVKFMLLVIISSLLLLLQNPFCLESHFSFCLLRLRLQFLSTSWLLLSLAHDAFSLCGTSSIPLKPNYFVFSEVFQAR